MGRLLGRPNRPQTVCPLEGNISENQRQASSLSLAACVECVALRTKRLINGELRAFHSASRRFCLAIAWPDGASTEFREKRCSAATHMGEEMICLGVPFEIPESQATNLLGKSPRASGLYFRFASVMEGLRKKGGTPTNTPVCF